MEKKKGWMEEGREDEYKGGYLSEKKEHGSDEIGTTCRG